MGRFSYLLPTLSDNMIKQMVENEQEFIIDLNKEQMYKEGALNVDNPQKEKYAKSTIVQKKKKARYSKTDFITLRWMGDFYESLKVLSFDKYFTVSSDSLIWANYLETQKRFEKALGLTKESVVKLQDKLKTTAIRWLKTHK